MGKLSVYTSTGSGSCPASPSGSNAMVTFVIDIPEAYRTSNITISWTSSLINSYGYQSASRVFGYKIPGSNTITEPSGSSVVLNLTNITQLGIRCRVYYKPNAYVSGGATSQTYRVQGYFTITVPWGGIETENIITAEKVNEFSSALSLSVSATPGQSLSRTQYASIANALDYTNLDTVQPLLSDLQELASLMPIRQSSTSFNDI